VMRGSLSRSGGVPERLKFQSPHAIVVHGVSETQARVAASLSNLHVARFCVGLSPCRWMLITRSEGRSMAITRPRATSRKEALQSAEKDAVLYPMEQPPSPREAPGECRHAQPAQRPEKKWTREARSPWVSWRQTTSAFRSSPSRVAVLAFRFRGSLWSRARAFQLAMRIDSPCTSGMKVLKTMLCPDWLASIGIEFVRDFGLVDARVRQGFFVP
jgi:hypothetical protein